MFNICKKNKWEYLIRYKDGSIPSLAEEYDEIKNMGENEEEVIEIETVYKRKPKVKAIHKMRWVNGLDYYGHKVAVMELVIEKDGKDWKEFQWVTSMKIMGRTASEFADTGRKRWLIENEGFNIQKNHRYFITHANSMDYNAMKNHYLLTQLADMLLQMYEWGIKNLRVIKRTLAEISESLLESLKKQTIEASDLDFERMHVSKYYE